MLSSEHQALLDSLQREDERQPDHKYSDGGVHVEEDLPQIVVTGRRLREISVDSLRALRHANNRPTLFVRSGELVHIVADESGRHSVKMVEPAHLRGRMERAADYSRMTKQGLAPVAPPNDVVNDILALGPPDWQFPPLDAIVEAPILRTDGTVLSTRGYDQATRVFYLPALNLCVPEIKVHPSSTDVMQALALLNDLMCGFPFVDQASRANALGLLLTPIIRMAIPGLVPLALVDAPQAGTGKSLLSNVVSLVTTGVSATMMAAPRDEEEWRKSITATLSAGTPIVLYDNVQHSLQSASLAMALTASHWKDRVLGVSKTITVPQRSTWIATGNNLRLGGDLARRCYWIRLDAKVSHPWRRSDFRHPDLISWVYEHRGELLAALLTLATAWYAAGKPEGPVHHLGSFEDWTRTLGGILTHAGVPGFLSNLEELYELADAATPQWEGFLQALRATFSETFAVAELTKRLQSDERLRERLPEDLAGAWGNNELASAGFKVKVGKALRNKLGTRFGPEGLHLGRAGSDPRGGQVRWRVIVGVQGWQGSNLPKDETDSSVTDREASGTNLQSLHPCAAAGTQSTAEEKGAATPRTDLQPSAPCYCCKGTSFRHLPGGGWVCSVCHPQTSRGQQGREDRNGVSGRDIQR